MSDFGNILLTAFGICLLIVVHELGHYLAARWIGARVEVFAIGFGPRLLGWRRGTTDYRIAAIPFGGYVQVAGQDPGDRRYPADQCLWNKSVGQRMVFYAGGVVMNLLFALIAFPWVFSAGVSFVAPVVGSITPGSAGWEAELQPGDQITAINGKATYSFDNLAVEVALAGNKPVQLAVRRGDQELSVEARPHFDSVAGLYVLGVGPAAPPEAPSIDSVTDAATAKGLVVGERIVAVNGKDTATYDRSVLAPIEDQSASVELRVQGAAGERTITIQKAPQTETQPARIGVGLLPRTVEGLRPHRCALLTTLDLRRDDTILAIDGKPFVTGDLASATQGDGPLQITVRRGTQELQLQAPADAAARQALTEHVVLRPADSDLLLHPTADGAAAAAGLQPGDRIAAVDGRTIDDFDDLRAAVESVTDGQTLRVQIRRASPSQQPPFLDPETGDLRLATTAELQITPRRVRALDAGFSLSAPLQRVEVRASSFGDALTRGMTCSLDLIKQLYVTLKRLATGDVGAKNLGGIIQISRVTYHVSQEGLSRLFYFLALLSINLAFINVLPIPVFDGGHLLFLLIERIKGSPVSTRVLTYSQILGLIFVLALVVFVTYNDILRLL